jgi:SulP family sulfate permease
MILRWFLFVTGIEVTAGIEPEFSFEFLEKVFEQRSLVLWGSSLLIALFLKLLQRKITHPLFVPTFYVCIPIVFYIVVGILGIPLERLRELGFLFRSPEGDGHEQTPFWTFWTYFNNFEGVKWSALTGTLATQAGN